MSEDYLRIIPTNPKYIPSLDDQKTALEAFKCMVLTAESIDTVVHQQVEFIDQGGNFEKVLCPACGDEVDLGWWGEAMDTAHEGEFNDLAVQMPCCGALSTLNDLDYHMPAGFAQFVLEAQDPGLSEDLSEEHIQKLETILGTRLKQVWAHY